MDDVDFYEEQKYEPATAALLTMPKFLRTMLWWPLSRGLETAIRTNGRLAYARYSGVFFFGTGRCLISRRDLAPSMHGFQYYVPLGFPPSYQSLLTWHRNTEG
jgi:hypothetical protein